MKHRKFWITAAVLLGLVLTVQLLSRWCWTVCLSAESVTPKGATVIGVPVLCGFIGTLETGSPYSVQRKTATGWQEVSELPRDHDMAWTMEAYGHSKILPFRDAVSWESLYGELPPGEYRYAKRFYKTDLLGNWKDKMFYAEFTVQ